MADQDVRVVAFTKCPMGYEDNCPGYAVRLSDDGLNCRYSPRELDKNGFAYPGPTCPCPKLPEMEWYLDPDTKKKIQIRQKKYQADCVAFVSSLRESVR